MGRRLLFVAVGLAFLARTPEVSGAGAPFETSWIGGRCLGCQVATNLSSLRFTTVNEAWGIGDAWPPPGGEGLGEHIVVHSKDGGRIWSELPFTQMHAASPIVSFLDAARGYVAWGDPFGEFHVVRTGDGGKSWQDVPGTFPSGLIFLDDSRWYAVESGKFLRTDNAGRTWRETRLAHLESIDRVFFLSRDAGWITSTDGDGFLVFRTIDGGNTWKESRIAAPPQLTNVKDVFFISPKRGWLIAWHSFENGSSLFATTDGGETWAQEPDLSFQGPRRLATVVRFLSESVGFVFENAETAPGGRVTGAPAQGPYAAVYTSDGGAHWRRLGIPRPIYDCQIFKGDFWCSGGPSGFNVLTVHVKK